MSIKTKSLRKKASIRRNKTLLENQIGILGQGKEQGKTAGRGWRNYCFVEKLRKMIKSCVI